MSSSCQDVPLNVIDVTQSFLQLIEECGNKEVSGYWMTEKKERIYFGVQRFVENGTDSFPAVDCAS